MTMPRPVVLGWDMVTPLGTGREEQWTKAAAGHSGVRPLTRFPLREDFPIEVSGEVPVFDASPYPFLSPRKLAHWYSPIFKHGMLVVHRALQTIPLEITPDLSPRVATTFSTAVGGLGPLLEADRVLVATGQLPKPSINPNSCVNMVGGQVAIIINATGPIVTTITACATGNTSMIIGSMMLAAGMADVAVCGAVDFPLVEAIVAGFASMNGAYQKKPGVAEDPAALSRPFSLDRRGFVIAEGAGCIILSTREFARSRGLRWQVELAGWGMNADAMHYVAPRLETVRGCMDLAIRDAGVAPGDIDAVNAHAASTKIGDEIEYNALADVFGGPDAIPPVTANKSLFGHAMGASSAVESILAMEGMVRGVIPPTINYTPDPALTFDCVTAARTVDQEFVLKNAFGFGGCNSCIVFRRTE